MRKLVKNKAGYFDTISFAGGMAIILVLMLVLGVYTPFDSDIETGTAEYTGIIRDVIILESDYQLLLEENDELQDRIDKLESSLAYGTYEKLLREHLKLEDIHEREIMIILVSAVISVVIIYILIYTVYRKDRKKYTENFNTDVDKKVNEVLKDYKDETEGLEYENKKLSTKLAIRDKEYELKDLKRELDEQSK